MSDPLSGAIVEARDAVVDRHKVLESVPGSGYHPDDEASKERHRKGEAPLSARPVAVQDDDRVHVVGACVPKVRAALETYLADKGDGDTKYLAAVAKCCRRALSGDAICMPTQEWNYVGHALAEMKVLVVHTCVGG